MRIDVFLEAELAPIRREGFIGQVKVAPAGQLVGVNFAAFEPEFLKDPVFQTLIKDVVRLALDGEAFVLEELEIRDVTRVFQVNQDADTLAGCWFESLLEQTVQTEGWEGSVTHGFMELE